MRKKKHPDGAFDKIPFPEMHQVSSDSVDRELDGRNSFILSSFTLQVGEAEFDRFLEAVSAPNDEGLLPDAEDLAMEQEDIQALLSVSHMPTLLGS